jgi:hypothetical protein
MSASACTFLQLRILLLLFLNPNLFSCHYLISLSRITVIFSALHIS